MNSRQLGGSPQLSPKDDHDHQPRKSIRRLRGDSLKRSQSIPVITTAEIEVDTVFNFADSVDSMDDEDNTMLNKRTESFKEHPIWQRRLSSSLPSGIWSDNNAKTEISEAKTKKRVHSMKLNLVAPSKVPNLEMTKPVSIHSFDSTDHDEPTASKIFIRENVNIFSLPPILQDFSIPWEEIDTDFNIIIGDGAFGKSYKLKWMETECLLTQYKRKFFSDALLFAKCQKLVKLRHPNLLQLLGFTRESENSRLLVITEQLSMTLDAVLKRRDASELTIGPKLTIAGDVAKALCYLHQQSPPMIHCAVIPANIHLTTYYSAKLSDTGFGEVAITNKALPPSLSCYLPLEAVTDAPAVSPSLDVFTFGVTLAQMVTHKKPDYRSSLVNKESEKQRITEVVKLIGEKHLMADLITQCLSVEPQDRPSAVKLCSLLQAINVSLLET